MKITNITPRLIEREMAGRLSNPRTRRAEERMPAPRRGLANCVSVEYHMLHQWFWGLEPETFIDRAGFVRPREAPGLGLRITLDDVADG